MSITANPFNHAGLRDLLMIEWEVKTPLPAVFGSDPRINENPGAAGVFVSVGKSKNGRKKTRVRLALGLKSTPKEEGGGDSSRIEEIMVHCNNKFPSAAFSP